MCGIVGVWSRKEPVLGTILDALRVLEYRGYDSVGVGVVRDGELVVRRRAGRIDDLEEKLDRSEFDGVQLGIGHSRWATARLDGGGCAHCRQRLCRLGRRYR